MTLREATALIALYRACADPDARARAEALVPDLAEWRTGEVVQLDAARRYTLIATVDGREIGRRPVVSRTIDLPVHCRAFRDTFDLATNVKVNWYDVPEVQVS